MAWVEGTCTVILTCGWLPLAQWQRHFWVLSFKKFKFKLKRSATAATGLTQKCQLSVIGDRGTTEMASTKKPYHSNTRWMMACMVYLVQPLVQVQVPGYNCVQQGTKDKLISQLSKKRIFFFISFTNLKLYTRLHESSTGKVPPVDRSSLLIWCCCFYFVFFWGRGFFRVDGQKIVVLWISQNVVHKKNNTVHSKMNWFIHTKVVSLSFGFWTCSNVIFVVDHL